MWVASNLYALDRTRLHFVESLMSWGPGERMVCPSVYAYAVNAIHYLFGALSFHGSQCITQRELPRVWIFAKAVLREQTIPSQQLRSKKKTKKKTFAFSLLMYCATSSIVAKKLYFFGVAVALLFVAAVEQRSQSEDSPCCCCRGVQVAILL